MVPFYKYTHAIEKALLNMQYATNEHALALAYAQANRALSNLYQLLYHRLAMKGEYHARN